MPQPTVQQVHVQAALTQIATAYIQSERNYVADRVFPNVPVEFQSDKYFAFSKDDFYRDEAQQRADATESAGGGFNLNSNNSYSADVWAYHKDLGGQTRRNADPAVNMDIACTKFCMQKLLIRRDRFFVSKYLVNGVWATDVVGTAGGTPGSATPPFWNDDANGDPFTDIANGQTTILQNTGFEANTLLYSYPVYQGLRKHPLVIDRIKYTTRADANKITPELLAAAFDVDRSVVSKAVYNTSTEQAGATPTPGTYSFVASKDALLCHAAPEPGLMIPSAGYIFPWSGLTGLNTMGVRVAQIPMPWLGLETVRTEGEMAFDMQVIGNDLGYHFSSIVQ
ncbi:hypothetical protein [Bradyrhizobium sp.]|uniref:hypothetical protein n=1 Tax=Bradyrhizobium sp. TaxID=376 RepID=UPI001EB3345D|nr:hypothetical protein [Bradyrhizobium sp.]MBV9984516.1 hypothetical protein [Bradyrhizobium sp.]